MLAAWSIGPFVLQAPVLLIGLLAAGIPILVHLLASVRAPEVYFSTLRFVRLAMEKTARRRRVQHWLLMLMRSLLMALLAMALAQPFYRPQRYLPGEPSNMSAVVILDNSMSMSARLGLQTRLDRAKRIARQTLGGAGRPRRAALLVTCGGAAQDAPRLVGDPQTLLDRLDAVGPSYARADLAAAVRTAQDLLSEEASNRAIFLISDMQEASFGPLAVGDVLAEAPQIPLLVLDCSGPTTANVGLGELTIGGLGRLPGVPVVFGCSVVNSARTGRNARVVLEIDGRRQGAQDVILAAAGEDGSRRSVRFEHAFGLAGAHQGRLLLETATDDVLDADDVRSFALTIKPNVKVLAIAGPPRPGRPSDDQFVLTCFKTLAGIDAIGLPVDAATPERIAAHDMVVACNVPGFSDEQAQALRRLVARGGRLVVFLGPSVDPQAYNALLAVGGEPLLPMRLLGAVGDPVARHGAAHIARVDLEHPLFEGLYEQQSKFHAVLVQRYFLVQPDARTPPQTLASLDNGRPIIVEHTLGRGRVVLVGTTATAEWTNLPTRPQVFLPLLIQLALNSPQRVEDYQPGQQVPIYLDASTPQKIALALPPDASGQTGQAEITSRLRDGQNVAVFQQTHRVGVYRWRSAGLTGQEGRFAVNPAPEETDLELVDRQRLAQAAPQRGVFLAGDLEGLQEHLAAARQGRPWYDYVLAIVLVLATCEALLANWHRPGGQKLRPALGHETARLAG